MSTGQALIIGALQGLTEFLPISSSGHIRILSEFYQITDIEGLTILIHLPTMLVTIIIFRTRIYKLLLSCKHIVGSGRLSSQEQANKKTIIAIILVTIITAGLGSYLRSLNLARETSFVGILFFCTGLLLLIGSLKFWGRNKKESIGLYTAIIIGLVQALAVLPGISRSGATISVALILGLQRNIAGEFSFLISLPVILGAFILEIKELGSIGENLGMLQLGLAMLSAFVVAYISLYLLLSLVRRGRLWYFSLYLLPLGLSSYYYFS